MIKPSTPRNEVERLLDLEGYDVLDTAPEANFDRITRIASTIINTPIALISLIDENRQWFKSRVGLEATETRRDVAFCAHAINGENTFIINDALEDERFHDNPLVTGDPNVRFYAGALLTSPSGTNLGTLCVIDHEPRTMTAEQSRALEDLAEVVVRELELRKAASTDYLTGCSNRRMFFTMAAREFGRARRYQRPLSACTFDLDHFKLVNDTYGHVAGDEALRMFAAICMEEIRDQDFFGRVGGEEFALILVETDGPGALTVINRILEQVRALFMRSGDTTYSITVSAGVAAIRDSDTVVGDLMVRADNALYVAKQNGRDQAILDE